MSNTMKIRALVPWFGSSRIIAPHVGKALRGCRWVGVPFAGGGTTLMAAEQLGRRSIGIELNAKYAHEIAVPKIRLALMDRSEKPLKPMDGQKELFT